MSAEGNSTNPSSGRLVKRAIRWTGMGAAALTFVGLMAAGITVLHERAEATAPVEAVPPVPVHARTVTRAQGYTVDERFVGRLEPARRTRLAFERSGLVTDVLAEEGDLVTSGQPVARLDTSKLAAERAKLVARRGELEAQKSLAELTLERKKRLMDSGHGSVEDHDEARFALDAMVASIRNVDASIASLEVDIEKSVLKAPFAGRVGARMIDEGTVAGPSMPVVELFEADKRQVRIGVSADAAAALSAGEGYTLSGGGRTLQATLIAVRPDLTTATRTVSAMFEVEGAADVPFGEIMELALERRVHEPGLWVPLSALVEGRKGLWTVYTLETAEAGDVIRREAVEVLYTEQGRAFVRGTLQPGARIVLDGTNRVVPGQRVALAPAEK